MTDIGFEALLQIDYLAAANALLLASMALVLFYTSRVLKYPGLLWFVGGFGVAALMYGLDPLTRTPDPTDVNLVATVLTLLFMSFFIAGVVQLVPLDPKMQKVALTGFIGTLLLVFAGSIAVGFPADVRAGAIAAINLGLSALIWKTQHREPEVGLNLLAVCLLSYPVVFIFAATGNVPPQLLSMAFELPYVLLGMAVLVVHILRERKTSSAELSLRLQTELDLQALNESLSKKAAAQTAELSGASSFIDGFNRTVAHDLKGAISAVVGGIRMSVEEIQAGEIESATQLLPKLANQAETAIEKVAALQRLAQAQGAPLDLKLTSMEDLAQSALREVTRQQPGQALNIPVYFLPLPEAWCDPGLIRMLFINLLSNAVKFSASKADVSIHIGCLQEDPNEEPIYFVRDTGPGFDHAKAASLFSPFGRASTARGEGVGVGISVVSRIVARHHGKVWAESEPGEGATFFFTLGAAPSSVLDIPSSVGTAGPQSPPSGTTATA